jgi:hypothetical protein
MGDERIAWKNKTKGSERRCMVDDDISECDCERLRGDFTIEEKHLKKPKIWKNDTHSVKMA